MEKQNHYFDYAAATPLDSRVFEAMLPYLNEQFANPSSVYASGRQAYRSLELARSTVAASIGAKKAEIIFTSGATESINLAIMGVASNFPGSSLVVGVAEHSAVLESAAALVQFGHAVRHCPVDNHGLSSVATLKNIIDDQTVLVSISLANGEIGTIQPISQISQMIADIRGDRKLRGVSLPLYLHTDASAAAALLGVQVSRLGVDLLTINGAKIYGPKTSGLLYIRAGVKLRPIMYGGGQERGLRPGTESVADAVGLAKALQIAGAERESEVQRLTALRQSLSSSLTQRVPGLLINGHPSKCLASHLNISIPGMDGETAVLYLDESGVQVATGAACNASKDKPSHVLLALGRTQADANASLRISLGRGTTLGDISAISTELPRIVTLLGDRRSSLPTV